MSSCLARTRAVGRSRRRCRRASGDVPRRSLMPAGRCCRRSRPRASSPASSRRTGSSGRRRPAAARGRPHACPCRRPRPHRRCRPPSGAAGHVVRVPGSVRVAHPDYRVVQVVLVDRRAGEQQLAWSRGRQSGCRLNAENQPAWDSATPGAATAASWSRIPRRNGPGGSAVGGLDSKNTGDPRRRRRGPPRWWSRRGRAEPRRLPRRALTMPGGAFAVDEGVHNRCVECPVERAGGRARCRRSGNGRRREGDPVLRLEACSSELSQLVMHAWLRVRGLRVVRQVDQVVSTSKGNRRRCRSACRGRRAGSSVVLLKQQDLAVIGPRRPEIVPWPSAGRPGSAA